MAYLKFGQSEHSAEKRKKRNFFKGEMFIFSINLTLSIEYCIVRIQNVRIQHNIYVCLYFLYTMWNVFWHFAFVLYNILHIGIHFISVMAKRQKCSVCVFSFFTRMFGFGQFLDRQFMLTLQWLQTINLCHSLRLPKFVYILYYQK